MALVSCSECKKEISDTVKACPHCGKKKSRTFWKVIVLVTVIFFIGKCSSESNKINADKPPEKTPEQIESELKFNRDAAFLRSFKKTLHNPSSLEIESVLRMPDDSLCVEYRATNKFNALILSQLVILKDGNIGKWGAHCAGKSGKNITYIRRML